MKTSSKIVLEDWVCCFYTSKFCNEWHAIPNRTVGTDQKHNPDKYSTLYSNLIQSKYFIKRSVPTNPRSCCHVCLRESMIMSTNNPIIFRWMGHDGLALSIQWSATELQGNVWLRTASGRFTQEMIGSNNWYWVEETTTQLPIQFGMFSKQHKKVYCLHWTDADFHTIL